MMLLKKYNFSPTLIQDRIQFWKEKEDMKFPRSMRFYVHNLSIVAKIIWIAHEQD